MSYHADPVINDLLLTTINDGDGSTCGRSYAERIAAAAHGNMLFDFRYMAREAARYRTRHGYSRPTREQILEAASMLQEYYKEHVSEFTPEERAQAAVHRWRPAPFVPRCPHCRQALP